MTPLFAMRSAAAVAAVLALLVGPPARADGAAGSLFICDVPASQGGCANGGGSPEGSVTFTFSGITDGDSFVNGSPASSPTQASEASNGFPNLGLPNISFSFSWLAQGTTTSPQTIFFYGPGGNVSDVLNYAYSQEGLDLLNVFGYVISAQTPLTVAELQNKGIQSTGSASAGALYDFSNDGVIATFQTAVPEASTWAMMLLGFAGLAFAGLWKTRKAPVA